MMPSSARRAIAAAALVASFAAGPAVPEPGRATDPGPGEVAQTTGVRGTVPEGLAGRWLVVGQILLPGLGQPFARLWEIRPGPQHLEVVLRLAELPDALYARLEAAGAANRPWTPDDRDLHELAEKWDELPPNTADASQVEREVIAADAYPPDLRDGQATRGSRLAIVTAERFSGVRPVTRTRSVYAVRELSPARLTGTFVSEATGPGPPPLAIALSGRFQAYRVTVLPPRPPLRRLRDLLMGGV